MQWELMKTRLPQLYFTLKRYADIVCSIYLTVDLWKEATASEKRLL